MMCISDAHMSCSLACPLFNKYTAAAGEVIHTFSNQAEPDVSQLQRLRKLSWVKCSITEISGLQSLTNLQVLQVSHFAVCYLSLLCKLPTCGGYMQASWILLTSHNLGN